MCFKGLVKILNFRIIFVSKNQILPSNSTGDVFMTVPKYTWLKYMCKRDMCQQVEKVIEFH